MGLEAIRSSTEPSVESITKLRQELRAMMDRTLLSLLRCYQGQKFHGIRHRRLNSKASYRDTALVLAAIETSARETLMDHSSNVAETLPEGGVAELFSKHPVGKQVSYRTYEEYIFNPAARGITEDATYLEGSDESLPLPGSSGSPTGTADAFTCSQILRFLTYIRSNVSHGGVYADAAKTVVRSLARLRPPQRLFGGASLTETEPNAFVSYYCLASLKAIEDSLRRRAGEHQQLDSALADIAAWRSGSVIKLKYSETKDFASHLIGKLNELKGAVGIGEFVAALQARIGTVSFADLKLPCDLKTDWIRAYQQKVEDELHGIVNTLNQAGSILKGLCPDPAKSCSADRWVALKRDLTLWTEDCWRAVFFQDMYALTRQLIDSYERLGKGPDATLEEVRSTLKESRDVWISAADNTAKYLERFADWGTAELQRQLAFYLGRQHTSFDPLQLIFSLRIHHEFAGTQQEGLISSAVEAIVETQQPSGGWAGDAPFAATPDSSAGVYVSALEAMLGFFPLLRESGSSPKRHESIHRMFHWLKTNERKVELTGGGPPITGWSNDRINDPERIDVWMSALALQFMAQYDGLLRNSLKRRAAKLYNIQEPSEKSPPLEGITDSELGQRLKERVGYKIFDKFILPFRARGQNEVSSLLLYGPPGTSKSTIAKGIARSLNWSLITITPSDFVKDGTERSEHWARKVFDDLLRLQKAVVFFDEIDEMLRSRDLPARPGTSGMLQFIVPGMLPKLQGLKEHGQSAPLIIVIATNYQDRLDPAVTRAGRVDEKFAIVPPDFKSRQVLLRGFLAKNPSPPVVEAIERLAALTGGWTYKELNELAVDILREDDKLEHILAVICDRAEGSASAGDDLINDVRAQGGYKILSRTRALNLATWYRDRPGAVDEAAKVLTISLGLDQHGPISDARTAEVRAAAVEICRPI